MGGILGYFEGMRRGIRKVDRVLCDITERKNADEEIGRTGMAAGYPDQYRRWVIAATHLRFPSPMSPLPT